MTQEEKINYFRISAGICGLQMTEAGSELLVTIYEAILTTKGELGIKKISEIEASMKEKHTKKKEEK